MSVVMYVKEQRTTVIAVAMSLVIHVVILIHFSDRATSNEQAYAPVINARIALNFLEMVKPQEEVTPVKKSQQHEHADKKRIESKPAKNLQQEQQQAVAPNKANEIQRENGDKAIKIKQQFFSKLLTHIEGYKFYPRNARKRGIEGSIQVSFRLYQDGSIADLNTTGGPAILTRAAKNSVQDALPLPQCPEEITCPIQISYAMQYRLHSDL